MVNTDCRGFIQAPLLIAIVAGILVLSGTSYFGVKQYQNYQSERTKNEELAQKTQEQKDLDVEKLRQEIEALKNQGPQAVTQTIIKEVPVPSTESVSSGENTKLVYIQNQNQPPNITEIVGNWRLFTAKVERATGGSGSGFVIKSAGNNFKILTNKHVIEGENSFAIRLPGVLIPYHSSITSLGSDDFATISLGNSDEYLKNLLAGTPYTGICSENQKPILGDEVVILGYPIVAGSQIDVTVTRGIISGFERNYYITDAKINPGNSGGVAISSKNNCYFGLLS